MSKYIVTPTDPGKAASVAWAAAVLYARTQGMVALNTERDRNGNALAYSDNSFEQEIDEAYQSLVAMGCAQPEIK